MSEERNTRGRTTGSSSGPQTHEQQQGHITSSVEDLTTTAQQAILALTEVNRASAMGIRGVNSATDGLKNVAVANAMIATGKLPEGLTNDDLDGSNGGSVIQPPSALTDSNTDAKVTQWKSIAIQGAGATIMASVNALWLTNFGTEAPAGVSEWVAAGVMQLVLGQGVPTAINNFLLKWGQR